MSELETKNKLWTKDFTILTGGSVVSMLGNAISGFAMGLLVLDYTESTLLYAIYMFLYTVPRIVVPAIAGPFLDKFSRKKAIYMLDFTSAAIYAILAFLVKSGDFGFGALAVGCLIIGSIDSVYQVAYESFYPLLISEGNYSKAYSISGILETLAAVMVPVSALMYNTVGIVPLFIINSISFFLAAILETQIKQEEDYSQNRLEEKYSIRHYKRDFQEGMSYLKGERGLWAIVVYFAFSSLAGGVDGVIGLPYFKSAFSHGEYIFIIVGGCSLLGRLIGGGIYYKFNWPDHWKYRIALFVYGVTCLVGGTYLYLPIHFMCLVMFISGLLSVTSYNIRISSTQSYVPDDRKGRYNGTFAMLNTLGAMAGQLLAGGMSEFLPQRTILSIFMGINFAAALFFIGRNKQAIEPIYNRRA